MLLGYKLDVVNTIKYNLKMKQEIIDEKYFSFLL